MISSNRNPDRNRHFQMQCNRNRLQFECNRKQRFLSRLHKVFDYLRRYIMPDILFRM